jgi:O-acetyl-ADP-ribose deacetylase (regulator of RNase III)
MIEIIKGNIFTTKCQTIVNTVNCIGIMGAGIAKECRWRYPEMYKCYVELCKEKKLNIGQLWIYKDKERWILNFPTKYHWKDGSKEEYLEEGLKKFVNTYKEKGINSIAFPLLGASNGGIPEDVSMKIMKKYLSDCDDIKIEIYHFIPSAPDDMYADFKNKWNKYTKDELKEITNLRINYIRKITTALKNENIKSMNCLFEEKGIGDSTIKIILAFIQNSDTQSNLFQPCDNPL